MFETTEYERKPFKVTVVQVTSENIEEVARWTRGTLKTDDGGKYVEVKVHRPIDDRQTKAYAGDFVLKAPTGFKVYTQTAFAKSFIQVSDVKAPVVMPEPNVKVVPSKKKFAKKPRPKPGPVNPAIT